MPRGTPRVSPPLYAQFLCWRKTLGNTQRANPGTVFPTYLSTTGRGGQKLRRHENAVLLYGQNTDLTTATAHQPC